MVEDETDVDREFAHHFGDGLSGFLNRFEDAHRKAAQARDVFGTEAGSDLAAILIVVASDDVRNAFDAPMASIDGQYEFRQDLLWFAARDPQCDITVVRASLFVDRFASDHQDLPNMRGRINWAEAAR